MNCVFVIMLPSILGITIIELLTGKKEYRCLIKYYLNILLLSNSINIGIIAISKKFEHSLMELINNNMLFAFKYLILLIIISVLLGFIISMFIKNVEISLEVSKNEYKKKSSK